MRAHVHILTDHVTRSISTGTQETRCVAAPLAGAPISLPFHLILFGGSCEALSLVSSLAVLVSGLVSRSNYSFPDKEKFLARVEMA